MLGVNFDTNALSRKNLHSVIGLIIISLRLKLRLRMSVINIPSSLTV